MNASHAHKLGRLVAHAADLSGCTDLVSFAIALAAVVAAEVAAR